MYFPPLSNRHISPGPIHNDADTDQANQSADQIKAVWPDMVDFPSPKNRQNNENSAISGIYPPEMRRLKRSIFEKLRWIFVKC
jgi:hypothetical protein